MILQTQTQKTNFFKIKRINNEPPETDWLYCWFVTRSTNTYDKSFYRILEIAKENESIPSRTPSCNIIFNQSCLPNEIFTVVCQVYKDGQVIDCCEYTQQVFVDGSSKTLVVNELNINTCHYTYDGSVLTQNSPFINEIQCSIVLTDDVLQPEYIIFSINSGKFVYKTYTDQSQNLELIGQQTIKVSFHTNNKVGDNTYIIKAYYVLDAIPNSNGYYINVSSIAGESTSEIKTITPSNIIPNNLTLNTSTDLFSNILPAEVLNNLTAEPIFHYDIFVKNLSYFISQPTNVKVTVYRELLFGDIKNTHTVQKVESNIIYTETLDNVLNNTNLNEGFIFSDIFLGSFFYTYLGEKGVNIFYRVELSYIDSSCLIDTQTNKYLYFEQCPNTIKYLPPIVSLKKCPDQIYHPDWKNILKIETTVIPLESCTCSTSQIVTLETCLDNLFCYTSEIEKIESCICSTSEVITLETCNCSTSQIVTFESCFVPGPNCFQTSEIVTLESCIFCLTSDIITLESCICTKVDFEKLNSCWCVTTEIDNLQSCWCTTIHFEKLEPCIDNRFPIIPEVPLTISNANINVVRALSGQYYVSNITLISSEPVIYSLTDPIYFDGRIIDIDMMNMLKALYAQYGIKGNLKN